MPWVYHREMAGLAANFDPEIATFPPSQLRERTLVSRELELPNRIAFHSAHQHAEAFRAPLPRAASAAPPRSVMNWRRRMSGPPWARTCQRVRREGSTPQSRRQ